MYLSMLVVHVAVTDRVCRQLLALPWVDSCLYCIHAVLMVLVTGCEDLGLAYTHWLCRLRGLLGGVLDSNVQALLVYVVVPAVLEAG